MIIPLNHLSASGFGAYGRLIEYHENTTENFQVSVVEEGLVGWRVAMMKVMQQPIAKIACHPNTMETFAPVEGVCGILVGQYKTPSKLEAFLLDRAVCIQPSVWHAVFSLSKYAIVRVTENAAVQSETMDLGEAFCICLTGVKE